MDIVITNRSMDGGRVSVKVKGVSNAAALLAGRRNASSNRGCDLHGQESRTLCVNESGGSDRHVRCVASRDEMTCAGGVLDATRGTRRRHGLCAEPHLARSWLQENYSRS